MRGRIHLLILFAIVLTQTKAQAHEFTVVSAGTILQCTLAESNPSFKTAEREDPILCDAGPLHKFGVSVFPRGAYLGGRFPEYRDLGRSGVKLGLRSRRPMVIAGLAFSLINYSTSALD